MDFEGHKVFKNGQYLAIYLPDHHLADSKGVVYIHRLVAERMLGRTLTTESVHHKDLDKSNNDASNLMIFKTNGDHVAFHMGCAIHLEGDVYVAERMPRNLKQLCPLCGNVMSLNAHLCKSCEDSRRRAMGNNPGREVLQALVDKHVSVTDMASRYDVSHTTVRRWLNQLGIETLGKCPSQETLENDLLALSVTQILQKYHIDDTTLQAWKDRYKVDVTTGHEVLCVETKIVFENMTIAGLSLNLPYSKDSLRNAISYARKTGRSAYGYHWQMLPKKIMRP